MVCTDGVDALGRKRWEFDVVDVLPEDDAEEGGWMDGWLSLPSTRSSDGGVGVGVGGESRGVGGRK